MAIPSGYQIGANGFYYKADGSGPYSVDAVSGTAQAASGALNVDTGALITLAAQGAGTVNGTDQINQSLRGLHLVIDITAVGGTPTLTVTIEGKDATSGKYYTLLASAALSATGTTILKVYPGIVAAANAAANDVIPINWRVKAVVAGTTPSVTATIAASLIN